MATSDNKMADTDEKIFIGKGEQPAWLTLALANRHGLVTGATGTGKTVSLQVMAEGLARSARRRSFSSNAPEKWASRFSPTSSRRCSGMCLANRGIRYVQRCLKW